MHNYKFTDKHILIDGHDNNCIYQLLDDSAEDPIDHFREDLMLADTITINNCDVSSLSFLENSSLSSVTLNDCSILDASGILLNENIEDVSFNNCQLPPKHLQNLQSHLDNKSVIGMSTPNLDIEDRKEIYLDSSALMPDPALSNPDYQLDENLLESLGDAVDQHSKMKEEFGLKNLKMRLEIYESRKRF